MDSHGDATRAPDAMARATAAATTLPSDAERDHAHGDLTAEPGRDDAVEKHLLFWLDESPYLVRLADLREVLSAVPPHVALPFSPAWLRGIFPLRTDLVALVDPAPILFNDPEDGDRRIAHAEGARVATLSDIGRMETPRALVVGEDDHVLALLADAIGDICALRPEDQQAPDLTPTTERAPLPQYIVGAYQIEKLGRAAWALHIPQLTEDIFAALEERPTHE